MAKVTKSPVLKARETKLFKKSSEELINIILKKDKLEKNLQERIKSLKAEINSYETRIKGYDADMKGTEKELKNIKDALKTSRETIDNLRIVQKDNKQIMDEDKKYMMQLERSCTKLKNTAIVLFFMLVVSLLVCIF